MIDLTPLDVRKKSGDFKKVMRGYDPEEVDDFLALAADRLEELVKESAVLKDRLERLTQQVGALEGRETAVQEALIMAQKLREDLRVQAEREAEVTRQRAEEEIKRSTADAQRGLEEGKRALAELDQRRKRFLQSFRALLESELHNVELEEGARVRAEVLREQDAPKTAPPAQEAPKAAAKQEAPKAPQAAEAPKEPKEPKGPKEPAEDPWVSALQSVEASSKKTEGGPPSN